jgi:hypothetical protein
LLEILLGLLSVIVVNVIFLFFCCSGLLILVFVFVFVFKLVIVILFELEIVILFNSRLVSKLIFLLSFFISSFSKNNVIKINKKNYKINNIQI